MKKAQKKLDVTEVSLLRWMCVVTELERIRRIQEEEILKKVQECRLKWYRRVEKDMWVKE